MITKRGFFRAAAHFAVCMAWLGCAPPAQYAGDGSGQHKDASTSNAKSESPPAAKPDSPSAAAAVAGAPTKGARVDPRDTRPARARALITTELHALEQLAANTPKTAPDHPQLLRRIAEDDVELELAARREAASDAELAARMDAIQAYSRLIADHPDYTRLDEVTYYLGVEYEAAGDKAHARKTYFSLIKTSPQSRFIPNAYLAFGEMFFDEAAQDPERYALAASAYREVVKFPPPRNAAYGYAYYKLGWALFDAGESPAAVDAFQHVLDFVKEFPDSAGAQKLGEAARSDLVSLHLQESAAP